MNCPLARYGEKIVKNSPNPRSYYKCSTAGCGAKKIVERTANGEIVATDYKWDHSHAPPAVVPKTSPRAFTVSTRFKPTEAAAHTPLANSLKSSPSDDVYATRRSVRSGAGGEPMAGSRGEHQRWRCWSAVALSSLFMTIPGDSSDLGKEGQKLAELLSDVQ